MQIFCLHIQAGSPQTLAVSLKQNTCTLELLQTGYKWFMLDYKLVSSLVLNLFSTHNVLNITFHLR
jgi:hypothetical protein